MGCFKPLDEDVLFQLLELSWNCFCRLEVWGCCVEEEVGSVGSRSYRADVPSSKLGSQSVRRSRVVMSRRKLVR